MGAPYGGSDKVPQSTNPVGSFVDSNGKSVDVSINQALWRFLARLASQFSGQDVSLMPPEPNAIAEALIAANLGRSVESDALPQLARAAVNPGDSIPAIPRALQMVPDAPPVLPRIFSRQAFIFDTRANRVNYPASAYADGTEYRESDATHLGVVYVASGSNWVYFSGFVKDSLANIPTGLGANDNGLLFFENVTYFHVLRWNNAVPGWQRAPGDTDHSDTFQMFGAAPTDGGWHACDGTNVTYLKYDGTTANRTLPNVGTAAYAKLAGTYAAGTTSAALPTLTMNPYTPAGSVSSSFFGTLITFITGLFTANAAGSAALVSPTSVTPAGSVSSSFSGSSATLTGTIALPGDPVPNFQLILYYRR